MEKLSFSEFAKYKNSAFTHRRFTHETVKKEIEKLDQILFNVSTLGKSIESREIYSIKFGHGKINILLWSQMHGNEATATAAIFDILNFLSTQKEYNKNINLISEYATLHFIPMLNPDGAERHQRENALNVDLNRDALSKTMPETKILQKYRQSINADIGFNLHDQRSHYNVSGSGETASISFLAPAFNEEKEVNTNREFAMKCISNMADTCSKIIPGKIARYNDTFGPRCIGDQFQGNGTATILIESGTMKDDTERQEIRQLNGFAIINLLDSLASDKIKQIDSSLYFKIPENDERLFDLLVRNANISFGNKLYKTDIGYRLKEFTNYVDRTYFVESFIEEVGDLKEYYGITEYDAQDFDCEFGNIYDQAHLDIENMNMKDQIELIKIGYTAIIGINLHFLRNINRTPFHFSLESGMDLIFKKNKEVEFALINDKLIDIRKELNDV